MTNPLFLLHPGARRRVTRREPIPPDIRIVWKGAHPDNFREGRPRAPFALVIHTMGGSLAGSDSWFNNPDAGVSAHYGTGDYGAKHQYVRLEDTAYMNGILQAGNRWGEVCRLAGEPGWATSNPNGVTVGIETEDFNRATWPVSDLQYRAVLDLCRMALYRYPTIKVLTSHHVISPGSRPGCAGARWTGGRIQRLSQDLAIPLVI